MAKKRKAAKAMPTDASAFAQNVSIPRSEQLACKYNELVLLLEIMAAAAPAAHAAIKK